jgi:hypothetical protein
MFFLLVRNVKIQRIVFPWSKLIISYHQGLPNTELVDSTADLVNEPLGYLDDKLIAKGSENAGRLKHN